MKLFCYFWAAKLVVSFPGKSVKDLWSSGDIQNPEDIIMQNFGTFFNPVNSAASASKIGAIEKSEDKDLNYSAVPSKDQIKGIEVSEIITKPPAGAAPLPGAPSRGPCSRYCSPTEYRSMDTNDGTGDHEEF